MPVTFGFPFGLTLAFPPNLPLPTKIVTQVLDPIDIVAEFGEDPDIAEVDARVRERMQTALDELAPSAASRCSDERAHAAAGDGSGGCLATSGCWSAAA